ncbi:hypothetical protein ACN9MJ_13615 [Acidovorax facilis]|uniref:hypothetical protein n=1 Tax=Acidovorax facilis TaxID=12917 RepID=UPI003CE6A7C2
MQDKDKPLNEDIQYLNGQIDALTALVLAVAGSTMTKEAFRQEGNDRLTNLENTLLHSPVAESRLLAIAHMKEWLNHVTG